MNDRSARYLEVSFSRLAGFIGARRKPGQPLLVGIDGMSASGKSTFSGLLGKAMAGANVANCIIPMDDLFSPELHGRVKESLYPGFDMEWIKSGIISPLKNGEMVKFRRYDHINKTMAEVREIPANLIIIFEGVFTTGHILGGYLDLRIWLDCPRDTILERGEKRSGEPRSSWERKWLPAEDAYIARENPSAASDLVVDSTWQRSSMFRATLIRNTSLSKWLKA